MLTKDQKKKLVAQALKELKKAKSVGIVTLNAIPDKLLQSSRNKFREGTSFIMGRKNIIKRILESDEHTKQLIDLIDGTCAIIISDKDPFELYGLLKSNQLKLAAKPKQIATDDIEVKEAETNITPGQALNDLKAAGIDVAIQKGKVVISKDKIIVRKGVVITNQVAKALRMLDMTPFSVAMLPSAILSEGMRFNRDVLEITRERSISEISIAFRSALSIALEAGIENEYTIKPLIQKAFLGAMGLGLKAQIYDSGTIERFISIAAANASALNNIAAKNE